MSKKLFIDTCGELNRLYVPVFILQYDNFSEFVFE